MNFVSVYSIPEGLPSDGRLKIYALVDPRFDDVRYVGVTSNTLNERLGWHLRSPTNRLTRAWMAELKEAGLTPSIIKIQGIDRSWQRAEMEWIAWFKARGDLLNVDAGGLLTASGSGWDDIKREKATSILNTAKHDVGGWDPPSCSRDTGGKVLGKKRKKKSSKFAAHVASIHPTVRKKKNDAAVEGWTRLGFRGIVG